LHIQRESSVNNNNDMSDIDGGGGDGWWCSYKNAFYKLHTIFQHQGQMSCKLNELAAENFVYIPNKLAQVLLMVIQIEFY